MKKICIKLSHDLLARPVLIGKGIIGKRGMSLDLSAWPTGIVEFNWEGNCSKTLLEPQLIGLAHEDCGV